MSSGAIPAQELASMLPIGRASISPGRKRKDPALRAVAETGNAR